MGKQQKNSRKIEKKMEDGEENHRKTHAFYVFLSRNIVVFGAFCPGVVVYELVE